MKKELTDEQIIKFIQSKVPSKQNEALKVIYRDKAYYTNFIWKDSSARALKIDQDFCDDLFQEVIITFLQKVWDGEVDAIQKGQIKSYVWKISENKFKEKKRKELKRLNIEGGELLDEDCEPSNNHALNNMIHAEKQVLSESIFSSLKPEEQKIIELKQAGKSHGEIGAFLGITADVARMRYHRSKLELIKLFKLYGHGIHN